MFEEVLTQRLSLRDLLPSDAEYMFRYRTDPEVLRYQSWHPQSVDDVQSFISGISTHEFNAPGWYQIGIAPRSDGTLIGDCGIHILETDSRIAEIGITIAPAHQSNGYATEALNAILNVLFSTLGKHRVFASVDPGNVRSIALMERVGMRKEAHFVQSLWFKDKWVDDVIFAMLAGEWQSHLNFRTTTTRTAETLTIENSA
jgi:RimJ/RimL family protein N-acetyltransferase